MKGGSVEAAFSGSIADEELSDRVVLGGLDCSRHPPAARALPARALSAGDDPLNPSAELLQPAEPGLVP